MKASYSHRLTDRFSTEWNWVLGFRNLGFQGGLGLLRVLGFGVQESWVSGFGVEGLGLLGFGAWRREGLEFLFTVCMVSGLDTICRESFSYAGNATRQRNL